MDWVVVQLSNWARSRRSVAEIEGVIRVVLRTDDLEIYIPVIEDLCGKLDSAYGEYVFIQYFPDLDYFGLENENEFVRVLRCSTTHEPQVLDDRQVDVIRGQVEGDLRLRVGDVVKIVIGPTRGNYGVVTGLVGDDVLVKAQVGQECLDMVLPARQVRRNQHRTVRRQVMVEFRSPVGHRVSGRDFGTQTLQIVRRGKQKSRVLLNGQSVRLPNEEIQRILSEQTKEDKKIISFPALIIFNHFVGKDYLFIMFDRIYPEI